MNLPGVFGTGVQTYGNVATKDQGKDDKGNVVFKGKKTKTWSQTIKVMLLLTTRATNVKVTFPEDANATKT
jgi:nicotinamide riboside transporter PnuC